MPPTETRLPPWKIDLSTTRDSSKGISRLFCFFFFKGKTKTIHSGTHTPEMVLENRGPATWTVAGMAPMG